MLLAILILGLCVASSKAAPSEPYTRQCSPSPECERDDELYKQDRRNLQSETFVEDDCDGRSRMLGSLLQGFLPTTDAEHTSSFAVPEATHQRFNNEANDAAAIWITVAQRGLDYLKDVLLTQVLEAISPFPLPDLTKTAYIPFVGQVSASFTNVRLVRAEVPSSTIALGEKGITMQGSNAAANMTLSWQYDYNNMWLPEPISDTGEADIKVSGMQSGVSVDVQEYLGTLRMSVLQCGTYIDSLEVQVKGASVWFYQWLVDVLEEQMRTTIEEQLNEQVQEGVRNLNSILLRSPQQVKVDDMSELNFTVVSEPIVSPTSLSIGVKGEFVSSRSLESVSCQKTPRLPPGLMCNGNIKMVTMALSESMLRDAAAIYYDADVLNWLVDKLPDRSFLNTSKWRFLIPQLYKQYPNKEMKLTFEVVDPPNVTLTTDGVDIAATTYMLIGIADNGTDVNVAGIILTASASGMAGLNGNNITGQVLLRDLDLELAWSSMGKIHLTLVKVLLKTLLKEAWVPFFNLSLRRGFPLPVIVPSMKLTQSTINYGDGYLLVCTDIEYVADNSALATM